MTLYNSLFIISILQYVFLYIHFFNAICYFVNVFKHYLLSSYFWDNFTGYFKEYHGTKVL